MKSGAYRYFSGDPLYRFGYGLSLLKSSATRISGFPPQTIEAGETLTAQAEVREHPPKMAGDEVADCI